MKKSQFETVLTNFKELAEKYAEFGTKCMFKLSNYTRIGTKPHTWENQPTFRETGREISLYFSDKYTDWSIQFGKVEISGYAKTYKYPWDITTKELNEIYEDAAALLQSFEDNLPEKVKEANRARVEKEIADLEAKTNILKDSLKADSHD
jgi:hypothetical protein